MMYGSGIDVIVINVTRTCRFRAIGLLAPRAFHCLGKIESRCSFVQCAETQV